MPGTSTPVSTNTVNNGNGTIGPVPVDPSNAEYLVDNRDGSNTAFPYGGYTTALVASVTGLTPDVSNLLTFTIADIGNPLVDSVLLIKANFFTSPPDVPKPVTVTLLSAGLYASFGARALRRR